MLVVYVGVLWLWDSFREKKWFAQRKQFRKKSEVATGAYNEQIRGIRDVKSLNIRKSAIKSANKKNQEALDINLNARLTRHRISVGKNLTDVMFEVGFIILGVLFIKWGIITLSAFLIIYMYHGNVYRLATDISFFKEYSTEGELSAERVFDIIENYDKEKFGDKILNKVNGKIEFKNVTFGYGKENVLKNVNLNFEANKTTAIVGKSGSGKSTILSLINRLYTIKQGTIELDGVDVIELTEDSLRENVGLITQSPYVFNTTIRENLLLVKPNATDIEIINALKKSQIYDFVNSLDEGLDSVIGENGVMLSGGQKQRIALARLLLKNPPIIMLDEATSALDNESQGKIVEAIDSIKNEHTVIVVAHRLSTIQNADNIIVIDNGQVVDQGKHNYLYKHSDIYKDLYKSELLEK
jgi:ATP-binding cassette subfamily B protein